MFKIRNGVIHHTRGDTADFDLNVELSDSEYGYTAKLSVKKNLTDSTYTFQVVADENGHITIPHKLTQGLPYGKYYYDIEICIDDGREEGRYVTVGPYEYYLTPDVTTY